MDLKDFESVQAELNGLDEGRDIVIERFGEHAGTFMIDSARYEVILDAIRTKVLDKFQIFTVHTETEYDKAMQDINELLEMINK